MRNSNTEDKTDCSSDECGVICAPPTEWNDEAIPDFIRNMHRLEDYPIPGEISWFITKTSKKHAFIEHAKGLRFESANNQDLCAGLILAESRGWIPVKLEGTPRFCSQAFIEACKLDIPIEGYRPTEDDLKTLKGLDIGIATVADYLDRKDTTPNIISMGM